MIHRGELRAIVAGEMLLLRLHSGGADVLIAIGRHFRGSGTRVDAAAAAIEADAIRGVVVDHRAVVGVVNVGDVHIVDAAIIVKVAAVPVAALIAEAAVAEAVINSAVEADVRTPIAGVPEITAAAPAPIAGSPQESDARRENPRAREPRNNRQGRRPNIRASKCSHRPGKWADRTQGAAEERG